MPIALVFEIFGVNVYNARYVHLFFLIGTILMFYLVVKSMFGRKVALLALLMSFTPYMIMLSRGHSGISTEGYIPSIFYLLVGSYFWFKAIEREKNIYYLILSGLFFGFSFQTKWLFLFAVPVLILTCIILSFTKNSLKSRYYIVPTLMVIIVAAGWTLFRVVDVGPRAEIIHLQRFWHEHAHRGLGEGSVFHPIIQAFTDNVHRINLWDDLQLFLLIPAFIYIFILFRKSKWTDYKTLFFFIFTVIWFLWWMLFNFDLPETHLRPFLIISGIFVAKLFYDVWKYASFNNNSTELSKEKELQKQSSTMIYVARTAIVIIILTKILSPIVEKANFLYKSQKTLVDPYNEMMAFIDKNTEKNAVFSGWGWSMPWYVDINNNKIDRVCKDRRLFPPEQRESVPEYFIVSPEWPLVKTSDKWPYVVEESPHEREINATRKKFLDENATLIKTFGGYDHKWHLYKINNDNVTQSHNK